MADIERDTHFAGFAKLLQQELNAAYHVKVMQLQGGIAIDPTVWEQEVQQMIAQRAYDLVSFAVYKTMRGCSLAQIPDIAEWSTLTEDRKFDV